MSSRDFKLQSIREGVSKGCCHGPVFWSIYINDLLHYISRTKAYADDITLTQSYTPE